MLTSIWSFSFPRCVICPLSLTLPPVSCCHVTITSAWLDVQVLEGRTASQCRPGWRAGTPGLLPWWGTERSQIWLQHDSQGTVLGCGGQDCLALELLLILQSTLHWSHGEPMLVKECPPHPSQDSTL